MQTLLAGGSFADAKERVINTVPVSWKNSWKVWPAVTAFSFTYVPWQYRNVFAGCIAVFWQTYLSWLNRKEERREAREVKVVENMKAEGVFERAEEKKKPKDKRKKKRKVENENGGKT